MKHVSLLIGIIVLIFFSQLMLYLFPLYGLISTVIIATLFLSLSVYDIYDLAAEEVFAYISVLPILSLFSYSLPWLTGIPHQIVFYFLLLLVSELFYSFLPLKQKIYHTRSLKLFPLIILIGGIAGLTLAYYLPHGTTSLIWGILTILVSSIGEAVYFQGLVQNATSYLTENILGLLFTIFLYGFFHITSHFNNLVLILFYMLIGSVIYMKWKNIYLVMGFYFSFQLFFFLYSKNLFLQ
jgi:membrane protease YdiL (CAAX protease family)